MNLSQTKTKGEFKWKSVYDTNFKLLNLSVINDIIVNKNDITLEVELDNLAIATLQETEAKLRSQLSKENCYLKTNLKNNKNLSIKLWCTKNQVKTTIMDIRHGPVDFSKLKKGQHIDMDLKIDSLWAHIRYYPNFIYKLKPELIQFCE